MPSPDRGTRISSRRASNCRKQFGTRSTSLHPQKQNLNHQATFCALMHRLAVPGTGSSCLLGLATIHGRSDDLTRYTLHLRHESLILRAMAENPGTTKARRVSPYAYMVKSCVHNWTRLGVAFKLVQQQYELQNQEDDLGIVILVTIIASTRGIVLLILISTTTITIIVDISFAEVSRSSSS